MNSPCAPLSRAWARLAWQTAGLLAGLALAGGLHAQPLPLRGVMLQDQHGHWLQPQDLAKRPVLLHFIFTQCSRTCPLQVQELASMHAGLPTDVRQKVRVVSVSVDPLSDTPATLAAFAKRQGAVQPGWHFVTGKPEDIERLTSAMRVMSPAKVKAGQKPLPDDHTTALYLFRADGNLVQRYIGVPIDKPRLVAEVTQLAR